MVSKRTFQRNQEREGKSVIEVFIATCHLFMFNINHQLGYLVLASTLSDLEMNGTDNKRTTHKHIKREREREKTYTNHTSTVTAIPRRCIRSSFLLVKCGNNDMFDVTVFKLAEYNRAKKVVAICKSNLEENLGEKKRCSE